MTIALDTVPHRVPGRLIWDPNTGALGTSPHGGTVLGATVTGLLLHLRLLVAEDRARVERGRVFEATFRDVDVELETVLSDWTPTSLGAALPGGMVTTNAGNAELRVPGSLLPGAWLAGSAGRLLFEPDDATNHDYVLLRKALCVEVQEIHLGAEDPRVLRLRFRGLPDTAFTTATEQVLIQARKARITV